MKTPAASALLFATVAAVVHRTAAFLYGPEDCVSLDLSVAGTCVITTECEGLDLSQFEFALDCEDEGGNALRHSFGRGGFEPNEEFNTGVTCNRCLPPTAPIESPVPAVPSVPAVPLSLVASQSSVAKAGSRQSVAGRRTAVMRRETSTATATASSRVDAQHLRGMQSGQHQASAPTVVRFGPSKCVSTYKSRQGHCMMRTQCSAAGIADYAFGFVCVDQEGTPVRHLFGQNSFAAEETFDTLIACDQCLGLEEVPDNLKLIVRVNALSDELGHIEVLMRNISKDMNVMKAASADAANREHTNNAEVATNISRAMDKIRNISIEVTKIRNISSASVPSDQMENISRGLELMRNIHKDVEELKKMSGKVKDMKNITRDMDKVMRISEKVDTISGKMDMMRDVQGEVERLGDLMYAAHFSAPGFARRQHDDWIRSGEDSDAMMPPHMHNHRESFDTVMGGDGAAPARRQRYSERRQRAAHREQERWGAEQEDPARWPTAHEQEWGHRGTTHFEGDVRWGPSQEAARQGPLADKPPHLRHRQHAQPQEDELRWGPSEETARQDAPARSPEAEHSGYWRPAQGQEEAPWWGRTAEEPRPLEQEVGSGGIEPHSVVHRYDILAGSVDEPTYILSNPVREGEGNDRYHWDVEKWQK